ncbi:hypothetical protein OHA37_39200 [Streptomyces sp. NBC_00335]|uniref:hypothetical protein n=1 Tax=unclassified Streptomyces TaxID=2593676 RepID=UPI00225BD8FC|nr:MULTISPECIES: hypothetical protein [unclassified Streptomyces]MCX5409860.1 hypothetical protein [Streptomyces sp. NBC_00086]
MHDQTLFRPWGVVDPQFWAGAEPEGATTPLPGDPTPLDLGDEPVSSDLAEQLAAIQAAAAGDLARAHALVAELDAKTTAARGEHHIETVRVREVRAYVVHLTGHHETAVAWYLHVVRLHAALHGPGHEETALAVRRAYSMWKALPAPDAVRLAEDLIEAFTAAPPAGDEAIRRVRAHLRDLHASEDGQGPVPVSAR